MKNNAKTQLKTLPGKMPSLINVTVVGLLAAPVSVPVEESAAAHLATIKRLQPSGPYRVGGECIGGVIAYEVAQQLWARGETVELLLLLDTSSESASPSRSPLRWKSRTNDIVGRDAPPAS